MSRDYKSRSKPPKRKSRGGIFVGIFVGLVIGILVAFGVAWYIMKTPMPFLAKSKSQNDKPAESSSNGAAGAEQPLTLPGKPGDKVPEKPRFDFYKILPGTEETAPVPTPMPTPVPEQKAAGGEPFYLQVGAFQSPADADNLKAKLALMGLEASVQQVVLPEKGVWHRVRIGPFAKPEDMNGARSQLAQNGMQATLVKGKGGAN